MIRDASIRLSRSWDVPYSILVWPELSGEAKVAALWLWNNVQGRPGELSFRLSELAAACGRLQNRGARRWLEYLVEEGLIEVTGKDRGTFYVVVNDPDEVAQRKRDELTQRRANLKKAVKGEKRKPDPAPI